MATELTRDQIRHLARIGAQRRLEELQREEAAIRAAFPDLRGGRGRAGRRPHAASPAAGAAKKRGRKRRKMSAAERRSVSERMKKYWAERRKAR